MSSQSKVVATRKPVKFTLDLGAAAADSVVRSADFVRCVPVLVHCVAW